jgi:5'-methylthioadenosine phosphorylase
MSRANKLGVIAGTSALSTLLIRPMTKRNCQTPYGWVEVTEGLLKNEAPIVFIERHGEGHKNDPSHVNYRANIWILKMYGVTHALSISAVGSLKKKIIPGKTVVIPDQIIDQTKGLRPRTFFDDLAVHVSGAEPICPAFAEMVCQNTTPLLFDETQPSLGLRGSGRYVCIEGPQFSTRAESLFHREVMHGSVVGMTADPEWRLAREAGLCYAILCLPADWDAWRTNVAGTDNDEVLAGLKQFGSLAVNVIMATAKTVFKQKAGNCRCANSLRGFALLTNLRGFSPEQLASLRDKYGILGLNIPE